MFQSGRGACISYVSVWQGEPDLVLFQSGRGSLS